MWLTEVMKRLCEGFCRVCQDDVRKRQSAVTYHLLDGCVCPDCTEFFYTCLRSEHLQT